VLRENDCPWNEDACANASKQQCIGTFVEFYGALVLKEDTAKALRRLALISQTPKAPLMFTAALSVQEK